MRYSSQLQNEYQQLFDTCRITEKKYPEIDRCLENILGARDRYEAVAKNTGIPWYFIAIVHQMECSGKFSGHLHNGDPLTARTKHVPKNHPKNGNPPFSWEDSAEDALKLRKLDQWSDWSVPGILFQLEGYNGFGYRKRKLYSPYLWSYSNHYQKGKFVADGRYDSNAVSKQIGAAVLLRRLTEKQVAQADTFNIVSRIKQLGETVVVDATNKTSDARELQELLNRIGIAVRVDGYAGELTSNAYRQATGDYLKVDSRSA